MGELFATGRVVDLIVAAVLVEAVVLVAWRRRTGQGPRPADLAWMLGAGAFLLLALRAALSGAAWTWVAGALAAALVAHLVDVARRWRG